MPDSITSLWEVQLKLQGLSYLFKAAQIHTLAEEQDLYGLGLLLKELASELNEVRYLLEGASETEGK